MDAYVLEYLLNSWSIDIGGCYVGVVVGGCYVGVVMWVLCGCGYVGVMWVWFGGSIYCYANQSIFICTDLTCCSGEQLHSPLTNMVGLGGGSHVEGVGAAVVHSCLGDFHCSLASNFNVSIAIRHCHIVVPPFAHGHLVIRTR